jgi:hypothetical protein
VEVLEDDEQRIALGQGGEQAGEGLEEPPVVGRRGRSGGELGEEARQLGPPPRVERAGVVDETLAAQRVHHRPEEEDAVALVGAAEEDTGRHPAGAQHQLLDEAALADAGLAGDGDQPAAPESLDETGQLALAADERHLGGAHARLRHGAGASPQDGAVELARLGLRLDAQLAPEDVHALLVVAEGGAAPAEVGEELHERAVHRLAQRVEPQDATRGLGGGVEPAGGAQLGEAGGPSGEGALAQALAPVGEPSLPGLLVHRQPVEEFAAVERERPLGVAPAQQALEGEGVGGDQGAVDGDTAGLGVERARHRGQEPAQLVEGVAQAPARPLVGHAAPEQRGEAVAQVDARRVEGEVGEQRLGLCACGSRVAARARGAPGSRRGA